jgi:hypothetical protein
MNDVAMLLTWSIAAVLVLASLGKLISRRIKPTDILIAILELCLAASMAAGFLAASVAVACTAVFLVYALHAFRPHVTDCQCFGDRLPQSDAVAQRVRNLALLVVAGTDAAIRASSTGSAGLPVADVVIGTLLGILIVSGPWVYAWAVGRAAEPLKGLG